MSWAMKVVLHDASVIVRALNKLLLLVRAFFAVFVFVLLFLLLIPAVRVFVFVVVRAVALLILLHVSVVFVVVSLLLVLVLVCSGRLVVVFVGLVLVDLVQLFGVILQKLRGGFGRSLCSRAFWTSDHFSDDERYFLSLKSKNRMSFFTSLFSTTTAAPLTSVVSSPSINTVNAPRVFVFSTKNMHVKHAEDFATIIESVTGLTRESFMMSLTSINDERSDDLLVSVRSVISMAKIMANLSAHQSIVVHNESNVQVVLAYELGKMNSIVQSGNDKIVIFTDSRNIYSMFHQSNIRGASVFVVCSRTLNETNTRYVTFQNA